MKAVYDRTLKAGTLLASYYKPAGLCYSIEAVLGDNGADGTFTFKDSAGTVVATATYVAAGKKSSFTCEGKTHTFANCDNPAAVAPLEMCQQGCARFPSQPDRANSRRRRPTSAGR